MFLIRLMFWLSLLVLLMPTDERQQERFYATAVATFDRASTFCERNIDTCAAGSEFWETFVKKAQFAGRLVMQFAKSHAGKDAESPAATPGAAPAATPAAAPAATQPVLPAAAHPAAPAASHPRTQPAAGRGTLTPSDLTPAWRGSQVSRAG